MASSSSSSSSSSSISGSCSGLFICRQNIPVKPKKNIRGSSNHRRHSSSPAGCVAMWFINGVSSAFFASLERFSCIRVSTAEDDDGDQEKDVPLIHNDGNVILKHHDDDADDDDVIDGGGTRTTRRRSRRRRKEQGVITMIY